MTSQFLYRRREVIMLLGVAALARGHARLFSPNWPPLGRFRDSPRVSFPRPSRDHYCWTERALMSGKWHSCEVRPAPWHSQSTAPSPPRACSGCGISAGSKYLVFWGVASAALAIQAWEDVMSTEKWFARLIVAHP